MDRWVGKVAIVTGASAGIGAAIARILVEKGMIVAGLARRKERVEELASNLGNKRNNLHAVKCDVTKEQDLLDAFQWVAINLGPVHVLINNAGSVANTNMCSGSTELWKTIIDTNFLAYCICTREAIKSMKENNVKGHIININSILGHSVPPVAVSANIYIGTKHAVTGITEVVRLELLNENSQIKITSLSPGATATEITNSMESRLDAAMDKPDILYPEDVADAVIYILSTPQHVQVKELTLKPTGEPF